MILSVVILLGRHYLMTAGSFQLFHFLWDASKISLQAYVSISFSNLHLMWRPALDLNGIAPAR